MNAEYSRQCRMNGRTDKRASSKQASKQEQFWVGFGNNRKVSKRVGAPRDTSGYEGRKEKRKLWWSVGRGKRRRVRNRSVVRYDGTAGQGKRLIGNKLSTGATLGSNGSSVRR